MLQELLGVEDFGANMKKFAFVLCLTLFAGSMLGAKPLFVADCQAGVSGTRTTFDGGKFTQTPDTVRSLSFTIDDSEPDVLVLEQKRAGVPVYTERLMIVNITENLILAIAINDESLQAYTILRKSKVIFYSNQRADYVGPTAIFPSLVSAMWGVLDILRDDLK
jgi:hypothetical protein